jgi:hypothetical protein
MWKLLGLMGCMELCEEEGKRKGELSTTTGGEPVHERARLAGDHATDSSKASKRKQG